MCVNIPCGIRVFCNYGEGNEQTINRSSHSRRPRQPGQRLLPERGPRFGRRLDSHIRIDLASRYLPERFKAGATGVMQLATALICGIAAWYGWKFVLMEFEYQGRAFAAVPA